MNLIETERLVRKLTDLLKRRAPLAEARPLAQAYAEACAQVNRRLEQCAAMLAQGDEHQALQLAEAPPPVLELVSRLAFRETNDWREFCRENDLPLPDPPEARAIRQVNAAYARGISTDHALYHDYREAVLLHQDERAVHALRSISWRNPGDANAPRELERLKRKILRARLQALEAALGTGDAPAANQVEAIESLDFQTRPSGEAWRRGQEARCRVLLARAREARAADRWADAAGHLTELRALAAEHDLTLAEGDAPAIAGLEQWVARCHKEELDQKRFERALLEVRQMLAHGEEQQLAGELPGRAELREQLDGLTHKWREIELAERPLGDELPGKVRKLQGLLQGRLDHLNRRRRLLAIGGVTVLALLALGVSVVLLTWRQSRDLAGELNQFRAERQVNAAQHRLAQIRADQPRAASAPAARAAIAAAEEFLQAEAQRKSAGEAALTRLEALGFTNAAPEQVQSQFDSVERGLEAVAKDYQEPLRLRFAAAQLRWDTWLDTQRSRRAADFDRRLRQANAAAARDLRYERGPEAVRTGLAALDPGLRALQELATPPIPALAPSGQAQTELKALQQNIQSFAAELAKWDQVQTAWRHPATLDAYLESLKTFQRSEFAEPAPARAAGDLLSLGISLPTLLGGLVSPGSAEAWAQFQSDPSLHLHPDDVMPGERTRLRELRDDENIHGLRLFRQTQRDAAPQAPNRVRTIYLRGQWENTRSALQRGTIYDPLESPNTLAFRRQDFLSSVQLDELGRAPEADTFEIVGGKQLLDASGTNYSGSLLATLDLLNRDEQSSPLFRAWLAWRLISLLELRPVEWGTAWAPAVTADRQRLAALGAESLRSGDWLVPARQRDLGPGLEAYFRQARQVSYADQARFLFELARRATDAGFALAGHADAAGQAAVPATVPDGTELWGWAATTRAPALLFRYRQSDHGFVAVNPALPFSPLLKFRGDRRAVLSAAKQAFSSAPPGTFAFLPPFYGAPE
jgi:hypothetical protein